MQLEAANLLTFKARLALRQRQGLRRRGQLGQVSRRALRLRRLRARHPDPWRLRLRQGIPRRALPARGHDRPHRPGQRAAHPVLRRRAGAGPAQELLEVVSLSAYTTQVFAGDWGIRWRSYRTRRGVGPAGSYRSYSTRMSGRHKVPPSRQVLRSLPASARASRSSVTPPSRAGFISSSTPTRQALGRSPRQACILGAQLIWVSSDHYGDGRRSVNASLTKSVTPWDYCMSRIAATGTIS